MSLRERALSGLLWSSIEKWGSKVFTFGVFLVLARLLEPTAFGLLAMAMVFIDLAQVFIDQGFGRALVQRAELDEEHKDTAFWTSLGISVLLTAGGALLAEPLARLFGHDELAPILRALSLTFLLGGLRTVQVAMFWRELGFKLLSIRSLISRAVAAIVGISMAFSGYGVWALVGQELTAQAVDVVILWFASSYRPRFRVTRRHFRDLFGFGVHVMGTDLLEFVNRRADDFLIGLFLGPKALGYYVIAYRVLLVLTQLLASVSANVSLSVFSQLQKEPERLWRAFRAAVRYSALVAFPAFFGVAAAAPEIVPTVFGSTWEPSIAPMRVLAPVGALHAVLYFVSTAILALGRPGLRLGLYALGAVLNIGAFFVAARHGIFYVAVAYLVSSYLLAPLQLAMLRRLLPFSWRDLGAALATPFIGSAVMSAAVAFGVHPLLLGQPDYVRLTGAILTGVLVYPAVVLTLDPSLRADLRKIARKLAPKERVAS